MSKITIIADPGSTWCGKKEYAKELVVRAKEAKCDAIKFQLFEGEPYISNGNIQMPLELFKELYQWGKQVGIPVTASVFNDKALDLLVSMDVHHVKFAYSQRHKTNQIRGLLNLGKRVVVTMHPMDELETQNNLVKLFTVTSNGQVEYPNTQRTNFEGMFPERFQGFSDHSLGYMQAKYAVEDGATWIEKHMKLPYVDCEFVPDARFALTPEQMKEFVWKVQP